MAISLVQAQHATGNSGTSLSVSCTSTVAGNLLVFLVVTGENSGNPTFTWPGGWTTETELNQDVNTNHSGQLGFYPNNPGGFTSVAVTASTAPNGWDVYLLEFSGVATSSPLDAYAANNPSTGSSSPSQSITTTAAGDLVIGFVMGDATAGVTTITEPSSPWTGEPQAADGPGWAVIGCAYQVQTSAGAISYNPSFNVSASYLIWAISFLAASGGGGGGATPSVTVGGPRGQWPNSPTRTTTRVPLTRIEHNQDHGIAQSDLTDDNAAQFYGDGTQPSRIKAPYGAWPVAPLRSTQRAGGFTWQPHNDAATVGSAATLGGVAANDLLYVPPGQTYQFFGIPDWVSIVPFVVADTGLAPTDSIAATASASTSDSLTVAETLAGAAGSSATESLTIAEVVAGTGGSAPAADSLTLAETLGGAAGDALSESLTISDTPAGGAGAALVESVTITESSASSGGAGPSDSLNLSESVGGAAGASSTDTLSVTDTPAGGGGATLAESVSIVEASGAGGGASQGDSLTLSDVEAGAPGDALNDPALTLSETLVLFNGETFAVVDTPLSITDTPGGGAGAALAESLVLVEVAGTGLGAALGDGLAASDATAAAAILTWPELTLVLTESLVLTSSGGGVVLPAGTATAYVRDGLTRATTRDGKATTKTRDGTATVAVR